MRSGWPEPAGSHHAGPVPPSSILVSASLLHPSSPPPQSRFQSSLPRIVPHSPHGHPDPHLQRIQSQILSLPPHPHFNYKPNRPSFIHQVRTKPLARHLEHLVIWPLTTSLLPMDTVSSWNSTRATFLNRVSLSSFRYDAVPTSTSSDAPKSRKAA